jgi:hypothetical protein
MRGEIQRRLANAGANPIFCGKNFVMKIQNHWH